MRVSCFSYTLGISAAAAVLAGCGGSQSQIGAPNAASLIPSHTIQSPVGLSVQPLPPNSSHFRVVYSFRGGRGGSVPSSLIAFERNLYGTSSRGGYGPSGGNGTVFKVSPSGKERVLYRFKGYPNDGSFPAAGLTAAYNTFYGTTSSGGDGVCYDVSSNLVGCGTIFRVTRLGKESVLHNFLGGSDGTSPYTTLTAVNGILYGTTAAGGTGQCGSSGFGCGTVFRIDLYGKGYQVLYSFKGRSDGANPSSGLTAVNGVLYGLTYHGGKCSAPEGCGTFFAITPRGTEHVLYRFTAGRNGLSSDPSGNLLDVNGKLYGTTYEGGAAGWGAVFGMSTSGKEHIVYSFKDHLDGWGPRGGLILLNGILYGTTSLGGAVNRIGCGTIFSMRTSGVETVLHRFTRMNGCYPGADLIPRNGALYGTTLYGGAADNGTLFEFTP